MTLEINRPGSPKIIVKGYERIPDVVRKLIFDARDRKN